MTNQTRRTTGTLRAVARPSTAVAAAVLLAGGLALGGCSKDVSASSGAPVGAGVAAPADVSGGDASTADLVDAALATPAVDTGTAADNPLGAGDHRGLRARLLRALHATWVTEGKAGPVTHQAIRGEVTAASGTSVTVKAKDGVSMTFSVTGDTRVRARANGKGTDSTATAIRIGDKAFVAGVGATNPQARVVVFRSGTATKPATPAPGATS
ncbi:hypothetical protein [Intrasporangium sp. YIM S08009]|uniref:hypothetical protein n=1 Tax=Intrasporangium zincisolvens TaxID=3080018 RepID=UPI002B05BE64|nr:hypothetical protein [Intrasporangium sp. YIM S08009]